MGKIIKNGISYSSAGSSGGSDIQVLTQEEYDALVTAGTVDENIYYFIGDEDGNGEAGDNIPAFYIGYDNSTSGLTATDIQGAVDEVNGRVDEISTDVTELNQNIIAAPNYSGTRSANDQSVEREWFRGYTVGNGGNTFIEARHYAAGGTNTTDLLQVYFDGKDFYAVGKKAGADSVTKKLGSGVEVSNITAVSLPYTAPSNGIIIVQVLSGRRALGEYANVITTSATITVDGTTVASKSGKNTSSEKNNWGSGDSGKAVYHQEECSYIGAVTKGQVINASATSSNTTGSYYYSYSDRNAWFIPV